MIRTILSIAVLSSFAVTAAVPAEPSSSKKSSRKKNQTTNTAPKVVPATPLASGWSLSNGVWTHVDGYKLVNGKVVRSSGQTHKKAPLPPTKAEMDAAMKKKPAAAKTAAELAAEKEAQRQRNLAPRPASQTGSHL